MKQAFIAGPRQAAVEEHRHGGKDDAAIGVMLHLIDGGVADPHRPVAAIAGKIGRDPLLERGRGHHAVERPQLLVRLRDDRQRERDELLHRARGADTVERLNDEIGVPQPAIAVVPGAAGARRLRDRGGMRGDDGAGLIEIAELERDRGADDGLLPVDRDRQAAHPLHPVVVRPVGEFAAGRLQVAGKRLVRAEHEVYGARQDERRFALDQRQRRVGGEADDGVIAGIADVVAAERAMLQRLAVAEGRPHADGDARQTGDRLDNAKQLRRPEHAAELPEARDEIGDPHLPALTIGEHGRDDRGVADIFGLKLRQIVEHDVGESLLLLARQQSAEDRIAVEARIAPPHHARAGIDQSGRSPVPDDGQIQPVILHSAWSPRSATIRASHRRTSCGVSK